jgi:hypothetical protein
MKSRNLIYVLVAIGITLLTINGFGQSLIDDYGQKPPTHERQMAVVKFHVALELMNGTYSPEQKEMLLNAIQDPRTVDERSAYLFNDKQAKQIFFAIGSDDIAKFRTVYKLSALADKRLLFVSYDKPGRAEVWRGWFAYNLATKTLTREQIDFLLKASAFLNTQNLDGLDPLIREAEPLFDKGLAREIFGSVGPFTKLGVFCKSAGMSGPTTKLAEGSCVCSVDHYNYSCNDTCVSTGCATTDGGCSFLWLRNCDGGCSVGYEIIQ